jgi:cyclase
METNRITATFISLLLCSLPGALPAQDEDPFRDVVIETVPVADGIWMLVGQGGNIGVSAGEDGVFLIDDQFAPLTGRIKAAIAQFSDRPVRFVINTHWHFDHTGGNENLGKAGAVIVAHDNVYERMSRENFIEFFNRVVPAAPKDALPVITFNDTVTFRLNGEEIRVVHLGRAHTDGDSVVLFRSANVIHTGDIWFHGLYPFIDVASHGSIDGLIAAVERILALADAETRIIPGHGPLGDRAGLDAYAQMLRAARDRVGALMRQGRSLDEIRQARPLADYDETLGKGFIAPEQFLEIVHASLSHGH